MGRDMGSRSSNLGEDWSLANHCCRARLQEAVGKVRAHEPDLHLWLFEVVPGMLHARCCRAEAQHEHEATRMTLSRAVFGLIFALIMLLQLQLWGMPIAKPDPNPTIETMLDPLIKTVEGMMIYGLRALIPAFIAALLVRGW
jgi:hypothetical protein